MAWLDIDGWLVCTYMRMCDEIIIYKKQIKNNVWQYWIKQDSTWVKNNVWEILLYT